MKKYEALCILNTAGKEEGIKEMIDKITGEIGTIGGKVETVQKMDKRPFSRVADKKVSAGFYVNIIFESNPQSLSQLRTRLALNDDVFRVMVTEAAEPKQTPVAA